MRDVSIALFMKLSKATRASADPVSAAETERRCAWRRAASGARLRLQARPSEALSTRNQRRDDPGETDKSDAPGTIAAYRSGRAATERRGGQPMKTTSVLAVTQPATRVVIAAIAVAVAACGASVPPPNDAWAAAQTAIGSAQAGGAPEVPDAKLQLQLALEDLQRAKQIMGVDNQRATSLCVVASTEAQLALSLVKKAKADEQAKAAEEELRKAGNP
jgi:hypothetical protein